MNRLTKIVLGAVVSLGLLVGAIGIAYAADPTPTPPANAPQGWQRGPMHGPAIPGAGFGWGFGLHTMSEALTKLLGMTPQEIYDARLKGQSLAQIAASKGVSEAKLVETILASRKAVLDARVKAGVITQEQADAAYKVMQERVTANVKRTEIGRPADAPRLGLGPGGMGPGGCWAAPGAQPGNPQWQPGPGRGPGRGPGMFNRWGGQPSATN